MRLRGTRPPDLRLSNPLFERNFRFFGVGAFGTDCSLGGTTQDQGGAEGTALRGDQRRRGRLLVRAQAGGRRTASEEGVPGVSWGVARAGDGEGPGGAGEGFFCLSSKNVYCTPCR